MPKTLTIRMQAAKDVDAVNDFEHIERVLVAAGLALLIPDNEQGNEMMVVGVEWSEET